MLGCAVESLLGSKVTAGSSLFAGAAEEESAALACTPLLSSASLAHVNCILAKLEVSVRVRVDVIEQLPSRFYCLQSMRVRASSGALVSLSTAADWLVA